MTMDELYGIESRDGFLFNYSLKTKEYDKTL
jgi:hypothetical protein